MLLVDMRSFYHKLSVALIGLLFVGGAIVGCDSSPSSVEDFDIQPNLEVSTSSVTFVEGQTPPPEIELTYQGLGSHPELSATGALQLTNKEEEGSGEDGTQVWSMTYTEELDQSFVQEQVVVQASGEGGNIMDSVSVRVNNPISVAETFESRLAVAADYEDDSRDRVARNGTSIQLDEEDVSENSTGIHSLQVDASPSGSFTIERRASLPDMDLFSFLVKPNPSTDFDLTITFEEEANGDVRTEELTVTVPSGSGWRKYSIAAGQLFPNFDPVAERLEGSGPLTGVSFSADADVTYHVDQLAYGTSQDEFVEIEDFERTTNEYSFGGTTLDTSPNVPEQSDGFTSRVIDGSGGGFGYNYDNLSMNANGSSAVSFWVGGVSKGFNLFIFLESSNGEGGFEYGNGIEEKIEAGSEWRRVTVPISELGGDNPDPSVIQDPGLSNVGFEVRRLEDDGSEDPINFLLDEVSLVQSTD